MTITNDETWKNVPSPTASLSLTPSVNSNTLSNDDSDNSDNSDNSDDTLFSNLIKTNATPTPTQFNLEISGGKWKKSKRGKSKRKPSKWNNHVAVYTKKYTKHGKLTLPFKNVLIEAAKTYKKIPMKGGDNTYDNDEPPTSLQLRGGKRKTHRKKTRNASKSRKSRR